jgi:two-component system, response regulator RegA
MDTALCDRPTMLLADDDQTFCSVLARAMEARGFAVKLAHDGASALRQVEEAPPEYAVLDLHLPDMTGLKVVERLRSLDPNTNIVLLTGYASIATAIEAIKLGATHYLSKPSNADQIIAAFDQKAPNADVEPADKPLSVDRLEWEHIQSVLAHYEGCISATARALNMHRRTLQRKLNKHPPRR